VSAMKTFSHLAGTGKKPSDYEISTTNLLYSGGKIELDTSSPVAQWYARNREGSPLQCSDWGQFRDPQEFFYRKYCDQRDRSEVFVDGILREIDESEFDATLSDGWVDVLRRAYTPLRYALHGLQMTTSYLGSMAPESRIQIPAGFQAADIMRFVQRVAYRCKQLDLSRGGFGSNDQETWERDPIWQPLRECVEQLLLAYDWGECFTALNLVVKPSVDMLFLDHFANLARQNGDAYLAEIHFSLNDDAKWSREWSAELVRVAVADTPANEQVFAEWIDKWTPLAEAAVQGFRYVFEEMAPVPVPSFDDVVDSIQNSLTV
jgi:toluene monooxygenase system protein E